jgi:hypothetical protein
MSYVELYYTLETYIFGRKNRERGRVEKTNGRATRYHTSFFFYEETEMN